LVAARDLDASRFFFNSLSRQSDAVQLTSDDQAHGRGQPADPACARGTVAPAVTGQVPTTCGGANETALHVSAVSKAFGGVQAVKDVTITLDPEAALGIIGPNGAGKSTLLKVISGIYRPDRGRITARGQLISGKPPHLVARAGIVLASQVPRPFRTQTVRQNVLAAQSRTLMRHRGSQADAILAKCGLAAKATRPAHHLGLLDLKRLEVARALATRPAVLLLDEVAAGLNGRDLDAAIELVRSLRVDGTAIIVVEHVERVVSELVDRIVVLNWGSLIAEGTPAEIAVHDEVRKVYLGSRTSAAPGKKAADRRPEPTVRIEHVTARYGDVEALSDVSIEIGAGEVVAILGANGAGKSTLASVIGGQIPAASGSLRAFGEDVTAWPPHQRARRGLVHCPEGRHVFAELTVRENLTIALPLRAQGDEIEERLQTVQDLFPALKGRERHLAGTLSGGEQQMLSIGRALMTNPSLLVCDELSLGLAPQLTNAIYESLKVIAASGVMLLLIEQDATRCLDIADWAYVLLRGRLSFAGPPNKLADEAFLDSVYFGRETST
jgi:ABC-type branched-subunit amino acid transport system ATPase component